MVSPLQKLAFLTDLHTALCMPPTFPIYTLFFPSISVCVSLFLSLPPLLFPSSFCPSLHCFSHGICAPFCLLPSQLFFLLTVFLILIRVSFHYNISPWLTWWPPDPFLATFHLYSHSLLFPPFRFII